MSFWQKVQKGVSQAAEEAGKQTAIARKNLEISGLKGDARRKTNELGDAALVRAGTLTHERLEAIVAEIAAVERRIEAVGLALRASGRPDDAAGALERAEQIFRAAGAAYDLKVCLAARSDALPLQRISRANRVRATSAA